MLQNIGLHSFADRFASFWLFSNSFPQWLHSTVTFLSGIAHIIVNIRGDFAPPTTISLQADQSPGELGDGWSTHMKQCVFLA